MAVAREVLSRVKDQCCQVEAREAEEEHVGDAPPPREIAADSAKVQSVGVQV